MLDLEVLGSPRLSRDFIMDNSRPAVCILCICVPVSMPLSKFCILD